MRMMVNVQGNRAQNRRNLTCESFDSENETTTESVTQVKSNIAVVAPVGWLKPSCRGKPV